MKIKNIIYKKTNWMLFLSLLFCLYGLCGNAQAEELLFDDKISEIFTDEAAAGDDEYAEEIEDISNDFTIELQAEEEAFRAGQQAWYKLTVCNTGEAVIQNLRLIGELSCPAISLKWASADGLFSSEQDAVLDCLNPGEYRELELYTDLRESQKSDLTCEITGLLDGKEEIRKSTKVTNKIIPLTAACEVKVSADKEKLLPGDLVTFYICIQNTGECTLHSVIGTGNFREHNIQIAFREKAGVQLNSEKTQAFIEELKPDENIQLEAVAKIPENISPGVLTNLIKVVSEEIGEQPIEAETEIYLIGNNVGENHVDVQKPPVTQAETASVGTVIKAQNAPTGDETQFWDYLFLIVVSGITLSGVFTVILSACRKRKS